MSKKLLFRLSIGFNIVFVLFIVGKRVYFYASGLQYFRNDAKIERVATAKSEKDQVDFFKAMPHDTSDIVMLGTSLTANFLWSEMFKNLNIKNRGIKGNTMVDMIARLSEITDGKPSELFIEAGVNDLGTDSINAVFHNLKTIITTVQSKSHRTKIFVQSVLPFDNNYTSKIEAYNSLVQQYCASNNIHFINLYPYFLGDKALKKELTIDGIHLNNQGYSIWVRILSPYLKAS